MRTSAKRAAHYPVNPMMVNSIINFVTEFLRIVWIKQFLLDTTC